MLKKDSLNVQVGQIHMLTKKWTNFRKNLKHPLGGHSILGPIKINKHNQVQLNITITGLVELLSTGTKILR